MNKTRFRPGTLHGAVSRLNHSPRKSFGLVKVVVAGVMAGWCLAATANDGATNTPAGSLADLSIEQLMNVSVTSASKTETKLSEAPAAITVITPDEIRRLGITSIPDALRLVPGLDVAQINSHEWAISARGFNSEFANKLLVLVDGRSIYGTGFGGVVWGVQDLVIEDVDRIEVIRGPGAALWGANAVNGVINIITKRASETQGTLVSVTGGTLDQPVTSVRYGGRLGTNWCYRVYGKLSRSDGLVTSTGRDAPDSSLNVRTGLRLDWTPSDADQWVLLGDYYRQRDEENQDLASLTPPYQQNYNEVNYNSGGDVLARWIHDFSGGSALTVQTYYDHFKQEQAGDTETTDTIDFDAQHRFSLGSRNEVTWGLGYRDIFDRFGSSSFVAWNPSTADDQLFSSFAQDEITLLPDRLKATVGSKLEHNDFTGFEVEPSGRLLWTPAEHQTVWAAVSRAVRTPAWSDLHADADLLVTPPAPSTGPLPIQYSTDGNAHLVSENVLAYELGYRLEVTRRLSLDVAGFYNNYHNLITPFAVTTGPGPGPGPQPPYYSVVSTAENAGSADTYGAEVSARWDVTDYWHLVANYSWLHFQLGFPSDALQAGPQNQAQLRSTLDLPCHVELSSSLAFVDECNAPYGIGQITIPSYFRLDLGVLWHPTKNLEFGLWGQNLSADRHLEFTSYKTMLITEIPRSVMANVTWHF